MIGQLVFRYTLHASQPSNFLSGWGQRKIFSIFSRIQRRCLARGRVQLFRQTHGSGYVSILFCYCLSVVLQMCWMDVVRPSLPMVKQEPVKLTRCRYVIEISSRWTLIEPTGARIWWFYLARTRIWGLTRDNSSGCARYLSGYCCCSYRCQIWNCSIISRNISREDPWSFGYLCWFNIDDPDSSSSRRTQQSKRTSFLTANGCGQERWAGCAIRETSTSLLSRRNH